MPRSTPLTERISVPAQWLGTLDAFELTVAIALLQEPGLTLAQLGATTRMGNTIAAWALSRLQQRGIVRLDQSSGESRAYLDGEHL